jgi:Ca2+-binding RTX toxin-like protein
MRINKKIGVRHLSVASAAVLAVGLGAAGTAGAAPSYGWSHSGSSKGSGTEFATAVVANDTLTITGTSGPDNISIALNGVDPNTLDVTLQGGAFPDAQFDRSTFSAISVFLQGGDDHFAVTGATSPDEPITVDGGSGDDTITTGSANDVIFGGSGRDNINSGAGDDFIDAGSGDDTVLGFTGHDTAFLGSGQDSFTWNPGDGSDFVSGDSGFDTLVFNGAAGDEQMSLSANGPQALFLRKQGNIRMDLDGIQAVDVNPLGGADSITVNDLTGTDVTRVNVDLSNAGVPDGAADTVTVNGTDNPDRVHVEDDQGRVDVEGLQAKTRITGSESLFDTLQLNTLGGNDRVRTDDDIPSLIAVHTDLGTGQV